MGVQELMLLILVLFSLYSPASFATDGKNFVPESTHKKMEGNQIDKNNPIIDGGRVMVNQSKYTTALTRGRAGDRSVGNGGNGRGADGNGAQSTSSPQNGGNGVIPVYAAGAAGQHRNEKGGASTSVQKAGFAMFMATTLVFLFLHIRM